MKQDDIEELPHDYEMDRGPSVLDLYKANQGKAISKDKFLYACLEEERTTRAVHGGGLNPKHSMYATVDIDENSNFSDDIRALFRWHLGQSPAFSTSDPLNYDNLQKVAYEFVHLVDDLSVLAADKLGFDDLPPRKGTGNQEEASQADSSADQPSSVELWTTVDGAASEVFSTHAKRLIELLDWTFVEGVEGEEYDLKSLPPIGRFTQILKRQLRRSKRDHQHKQRRKQGRTRTSAGKSNRDQQQVAEREAVDACEKLRQDSSIDGLVLKPQNSFVRRLQHKKIAALGFASSSVGDGPDRAVKVFRESLE